MEENTEKSKFSIFKIITTHVLLIILSFLLLIILSTKHSQLVIIYNKLPEDIVYKDYKEIEPDIKQAIEEYTTKIAQSPNEIIKEYYTIVTQKPPLLLLDRLIWALCFVLPGFLILSKILQVSINKLNDDLDFSHLGLGLLRGLYIFLLVSLSSIVMTLFNYKPKPVFFNQILFESMHGNIYLLLWSIFTVGIVTGLIEELFFRGYLLHQFIDSGHTKAGLFFTSTIFGFMHYSSEASLVVPILITFVGLFFGYTYIKFKNIWICVFTHATYNSIGLVIAYFIGDQVYK